MYKYQPKNYKILCANAMAFIMDSGVAVREFCRRCNLAPSTFYSWRRGEIRISYKRAEFINEYLKLFGYEAGRYPC